MALVKGGDERHLRAVGCEMIYAFIYRAAQRTEQLWRYLTRPASQTPRKSGSVSSHRQMLGASRPYGHFQAILKELGKDLQNRFA